jgi:hypothetical protein
VAGWGGVREGEVMRGLDRDRVSPGQPEITACLQSISPLWSGHSPYAAEQL